MNATLLLIALAAYKPNFEKKYFTECYEREDADTCKRRQERWNSSMEQYKKELAEERDRELGYLKGDAEKVNIKALPGRETVAPLAPTWCKGAIEEEDGNLSALRQIGSGLNTFADQRYFSFDPLVRSAKAMCFAPDNADVKKLATAMIQVMVNSIGYSSAEAIADLTARLDSESLKKTKAALCEELKISEEAEGDVKSIAVAKWHLFGCDEKDKLDVGLWLDVGGIDTNNFAYWLDSAAQVESEALRLAYLLAVTRNSDDLGANPFRAVQYAMIQQDLPAFDPAKLKKELSGAPYDGNVWATLSISEALGSIKRQGAEYQAAIDQLVKKDEGWKEILVEAPKKAVADWSARAQKFNAALTRSREFEKKAFGPSRKAAKGCSKDLRSDFNAYLKTVNASSPREFSALVVGDSVGSLLLQRLIACEGAEGHGRFAGMLKSTLELGRVLRGPRFAAVYAAIEALGEVKKDRPKFPLEPSSVHAPWNDELLKRFDDSIESVGVKFYDENMHGSVVKSVARQGDKLKVVFITETFQYNPTVCVNTNRIMRITAAGMVEYWRSCHISKDVVTGIKHLDDAIIPADLGAGIKPGAFVEVTNDRDLPLSVYADKSQKKLTAWRGFGL